MEESKTQLCDYLGSARTDVSIRSESKPTRRIRRSVCLSGVVALCLSLPCSAFLRTAQDRSPLEYDYPSVMGAPNVTNIITYASLGIKSNWFAKLPRCLRRPRLLHRLDNHKRGKHVPTLLHLPRRHNRRHLLRRILPPPRSTLNKQPSTAPPTSSSPAPAPPTNSPRSTLPAPYQRRALTSPISPKDRTSTKPVQARTSGAPATRPPSTRPRPGS